MGPPCLLLCRFLDAGNDEMPPVETAGVQKAPRHEVAEVWRRLCRERYGDLIFVSAVMVGAMPAPGALDECARGGLEAHHGHLGRRVDRIDGRSVG